MLTTPPEAGLHSERYARFSTALKPLDNDNHVSDKSEQADSTVKSSVVETSAERYSEGGAQGLTAPSREGIDPSSTGGDWKARIQSSIGPADQSVAQPPEDLEDPDQPSTEPVKSLPASILFDPQKSWYYRFLSILARACNTVNFLTTQKARRAREWCDLPSTPDRIRHTCQDLLTRQWARHLYGLQVASPAAIACGQLAFVVDEVSKLDERELEVFEFCAGSGGPTPIFERLINQQRTHLNKPPLQFSISDICPNPEAWNEITTGSNHLRAIEEKVDAAAPPSAALSHYSRRPYNEDLTATSQNRIFRLFNLSFHHFDDVAAVDILRSTMNTADGVAVIELQDRRLGCLSMMLFNPLFLINMMPFSRPPPEHLKEQKVRNWFRNLGTYIRIILTLGWDGLGSCFRTREFLEFVKLVEDAAEVKSSEKSHVASEYQRVCTIGDWEWREHTRILHTFPFAYVKMFTGVRKPE